MKARFFWRIVRVMAASAVITAIVIGLLSLFLTVPAWAGGLVGILVATTVSVTRVRL